MPWACLPGHRESLLGVRGAGGEQVRKPSLIFFPPPPAVWNRIIEPVAAMRKEADMLRLFPEYLKGEELFGLTVHAVLRIAESVCTQGEP